LGAHSDCSERNRRRKLQQGKRSDVCLPVVGTYDGAVAMHEVTVTKTIDRVGTAAGDDGAVTDERIGPPEPHPSGHHEDCDHAGERRNAEPNVAPSSTLPRPERHTAKPYIGRQQFGSKHASRAASSAQRNTHERTTKVHEGQLAFSAASSAARIDRCGR